VSDYLDEFAEEKSLIQARDKRWRDDRNEAAEAVLRTAAGKKLLFYLVSDMRLFDPVTTDAEVTMRNFAVDMLREYIGVFADREDHRSMVFDAILGVQRPVEEEDE